MKHVDVAHLWLQDEVKSIRLSLHRVKSEDNLADIGTEAVSNKTIRKHAISMAVRRCSRKLEVRRCHGVWVDSRKRHRSQLLAMPDSSSSGGDGSWISLRVTKRDDSKSDVSPSCGPFSHQRIVCQFQLFIHWVLEEPVCGQHEVLGGGDRRRQHGATCGNIFRLDGQQLARRRFRWSGSKRKDS